MNAITEQAVLDALRAVQDPDLNRDIVTLKFVKEVVIEGDSVRATVQLTTPACPVKDQLHQECVDAISAIPGVNEVEVTMTARVPERPTQGQDMIPGVKQVIAVASGKGGVGKSTLTINLAAALAAKGARVGILDADVYGPSIPLMTGTATEKPLTQDSKIVPIQRFGVGMMSLGYLLDDNQAVLWRGPMVAGTVKQLLADVAWGELDYLLVDLPPGTGDAPMTLAQSVPLSGVVIVMTPHSVAANIAGKAAGLFRRLNAPILGVIENMAVFACPSCGTPSRIFAGQSGAELAESLKVPFLGSVPLDPMVSQAAEQGLPSVVAMPDSVQAAAFSGIADEMARYTSIRALAKEASEPSFAPSRPL